MSLPTYRMSPWATRAIYLFALVLIAMPMLDFVTSIMPARVGDLNWRYGALGLMPGYLHTPMLGIVLAFGAAYAEGRDGLMRVIGAACLLGAVALLLAAGVFGLDVIQMREIRSSQDQVAVLLGGAIQGTKYLTSGLVLALLGYGALQTGRAARRRDRSATAAGLVARNTSPPQKTGLQM